MFTDLTAAEMFLSKEVVTVPQILMDHHIIREG
jgi:hypothetical protein